MKYACRKHQKKKNNKKKYSLGKTKWLIHRQWFHAFHIFIYVFFFVYRLRGNDFTKWITKYALHLFKKRVEFVVMICGCMWLIFSFLFTVHLNDYVIFARYNSFKYSVLYFKFNFFYIFRIRESIYSWILIIYLLGSCLYSSIVLESITYG